MLFLVKGRVEFTPYMNDREKPENVYRLVEAESRDEAGRKFNKHYNDKSEQNDDSYFSTVREVLEVIT